MNRTWSFYRTDSGEFIGRTFSGGERLLALNTPAGCSAIEGVFDHLSRRVNVATKNVESYRPQRPSPDHDWDEVTERWRKRTDVVSREQMVAAALAEIERLERSQWRSVRELALDSNRADSRQRLSDIDARIAELRTRL